MTNTTDEKTPEERNDSHEQAPRKGHCPHCGRYLYADQEWRLHPDLTPGKLDTEYGEDVQQPYLHAGCYNGFVEALE